MRRRHSSSYHGKSAEIEFRCLTIAWRQTMEMLSVAEMIVQSLTIRASLAPGYPGRSPDIYDALHTPGGIEACAGSPRAGGGAYGGWSRERPGRSVWCWDLWAWATNAITGIATAYMDSVPLVILSRGRVATSLIGYDAFQECDMVGISAGGEAQFPGEADRRYSRRAEESLLAGGQRSPRSGSGRSAEGYSQSGEEAALRLAGRGDMRSYNPTTK